jgi:hypothetical protein
MAQVLQALSAMMLALLFVSVTPAEAQLGARLQVRVLDDQKAALPGVTLTIESPALVGGRATTVTDGGGIGSFLALVSGLYSVTAELPGFQTVRREGITVAVGQTTPLTLVLPIASLEESVTVVGASPVVDTTSGRVNVILTESIMQETPGGRNIYALSEYKVPGLVTNRPDVGGAEGAFQAGLRARGTPTSQTTLMLGGINVTDGGAAGATQYYFDYESFAEVEVVTGGIDLSVPAAGVFVNMVAKQGGDTWSGKTGLRWQGKGTQGTNITQDLREFGLSSDASAVEFISDASLQMGGPLIRDKLRLFTSFRDWRTHRRVPGFPEVESTEIFNLLGNVTWQLNESHRLGGFAGRNYYNKPNRGASALFEPASVANEKDHMSVYQGHWNWVISDKAFLDARTSHSYMYFPLYLKSDDQTLFDQATGFRSRARNTESKNYRKRFQQKVDLQYYLDRALGGRHEFRVGVDIGHIPVENHLLRNDDLDQSWNSATGRATEVTLYNTPVNRQEIANSVAFYAQDAYSVKRLTFAGGLRWERFEGYYPAQGSVPSRWFPDMPRSFDEVRNVVRWTSLGPRMSVVYDLLGNGKTALKGTAGRYNYVVGTSQFSGMNRNGEIFERYVWNDLNGDLFFQPGEAGALLARGGGLTTEIDPDMKRPYTDELTLGLDHELVSDLRLSVSFIQRREVLSFGSVNVGVPASAFSPVAVIDPGRDGILGTADDGQFTVYSQARETLGQERSLVTNHEAFEGDFRGMEITATKRLSNRWQMIAGYTAGRAVDGEGGAIDSPNDLINRRGPATHDSTHIFKLTGTYQLPAGIQASGNFRRQTGKPVTRQARFGLTQGSVLVNVEPRGNERMDPITTLDLRFTKNFDLGANGRSLQTYVSGYNLTNANTVWGVRSLTGRLNVREGGAPDGQVFNQQQYFSPTDLLSPRIFQFGAVLSF